MSRVTRADEKPDAVADNPQTELESPPPREYAVVERPGWLGASPPPGSASSYEVDEPATLAHDHWVVTQAGELIGYCCFGAPARVGGAEAEPGTLDVGYGLAPDRIGHGLGHRFVGVILEFALGRYDPERLRLYVRGSG